jgi:hypothetical protein
LSLLPIPMIDRCGPPYLRLAGRLLGETRLDSFVGAATR